jgi:hypothetical protein
MVDPRRGLSEAIKTAMRIREDTADFTAIGQRTTCASIGTRSQILTLFTGFRDLVSGAK